MTLEEALVKRHEAMANYWKSPYGSPEESIARTERDRLNRLIQFLILSPTQQLCAVARKIAEQDKHADTIHTD